MTEIMAAFFAHKVALFVVAFAALMGKFEAAFVVKLMVALGAFVKVTVGHPWTSFRRASAIASTLHNMHVGCGVLP
ncbi:MAG: hypothetical protein RIN56_17250 [Sporomusaceae bacterium]|nr:hypothetical protein [Sporomusaceae bacterium]